MFLIGRPVYWFLTPDPWEKLARFEAFVFSFWLRIVPLALYFALHAPFCPVESEMQVFSPRSAAL
jgi:hypothetical protein